MLQRAQPQQKTTTTTRRPAIPLAIALLLGVAAHPLIPPYPLASLLTIAALAAAALLLIRHAISSTALLCTALFLAGTTAAHLELHYYPPTDIAHFTTTDRRLATVDLTLLDPPRVNDTPRASYPTAPRQFTRAAVRHIHTSIGPTPASGQVLFHLERPLPTLAAGQTLRVTGFLSRLAPVSNPGQFDFPTHYRRQRLLATLSTRQAQGNVQLLSPAPTIAPLTTLRAKTRDLLSAGFSDAQRIESSLLRALLLGDRDPALRDIQDTFVRTGTSHHLAISGMHVAVLTGFVYLLCHLLRLHPRTTAYVAISFSLLYAAAALPNPPVVRSVLLCAFLITGTLLRQHPDPVQLLALSVFAMLVYDPLDLYDIGFQLSFGTVLGLMLFSRRLHDALFPTDPDLALAPKKKRPAPIRLLSTAWRNLRLAIAAAVVAWFISLPMILHHFDRLNPWAILASLLLAPIVFCALLAGLFKVVLTLLLPWLAALWAHAAWLPIYAMHKSVDLLALLPGSDITLRPPPVPVTILYYAALLFTLLPALSRAARRAIVLTACTTILALPVTLTAIAGHHPDETRVTVLSVGPGSCAVVETNTGHTYLIDAGSSGSADLYRNTIEPFLRTRGIRRIDAAFVSHADADHYSALPELAADRGPPVLYLTPHFLADDSPSATRLVETLRPTTITAPHSFQLTPDTTLDLLWPPPDVYPPDSNDQSMVLKLTTATRSVLFPGDIQSPAMTALLSTNPAALDADILIAPHHGSFEDTTPEFVRAISPTHILSSDDRTPTRKQRTFDAELGPTYPILHTHTHGALTITIHRDGTLTLTPFRSP